VVADEEVEAVCRCREPGTAGCQVAAGLLDYAIHVVTNAGTLWRDISPAQRAQLQAFLFPEGLRWRRGAFVRTATTGLLVSGLGLDSEGDSSMVALQAPASNRVGECPGRVAKLREASQVAA
jgi:hypothetical protein